MEKERLFKEGEAVTAGVAKVDVVGGGDLVRIGGTSTPLATASTSAQPYDPAVDSLSPELLDVEHIVRSEGIAIYKDQAGRLWTGLATYWIKQGEFDIARQTFEQGIQTVLTLRDFTQIFDAFAEFSESYISSLMDGLKEDAEEDAEEGEREEEERELDDRMREFEELMDRRPLLVNEVLLRRNPNDVQEWEKRIALYGDDDEKVSLCLSFLDISLTRNKRSPKRTRKQRRRSLLEKLPRIITPSGFISPNSTRWEGRREKRRRIYRARERSLRKLLQCRTRRSMSSLRFGVNGLRWKCGTSESPSLFLTISGLTFRNRNYDDAIKVMQRATAVPKKVNVGFHDESLSVQARLFKSLKLWSFYVDLEESIGSVETTKAVYDKMFELKIANAQTVINFANFLEENQYWEESFKVRLSLSRRSSVVADSVGRSTNGESICSAILSLSRFGIRI